MVNRAARVSGLAHGGQVVISGRTWREIEADISFTRLILIAAKYFEPAKISGVDILALGDHALKGIKGKEQIIQILPITLAGRKFPPLNNSDAKQPHFKEQVSASAPSSAGICFTH